MISLKERKMLVLSLIVLIFSGMFLFVNPSIFLVRMEDESKRIGSVTTLTNNAKIKYSNSISWINLSENDPVYTDSLVYTEDETDAEYTLADNSMINQSPSTLLKLQFKTQRSSGLQMMTGQIANINIGLIRGSIDLKVEKGHRINKLTLKDSSIQFKDEEVEVKIDQAKEGGATISVGKGEVEVKKGDQVAMVSEGRSATTSKDTDTIEVKDQTPPYEFPKRKNRASKPSFHLDGRDFKKFVKKLGRIFYVAE